MNRNQIEKAIADAETLAVKMAQDFAAGTITATQFSSQFDDHKDAMDRLRVMLRDAVTNPATKPAPQPEPPKPCFVVGQQVRIVGPWFGGDSGCIEIGATGDLIRIRHKNNDSKKELAYDVKVGNNLPLSYPASSLTLASEVPAPRFKRGDKVQRVTGGVQLTVTGIEYDGKVWVYIFHTNNTTLVIAEEYLSPAPADENGVQVDFVRLTEAGYEVGRDGEAKFAWRCPASDKWIASDTAIDAWRAAGRHYLENREKK